MDGEGAAAPTAAAKFVEDSQIGGTTTLIDLFRDFGDQGVEPVGNVDVPAWPHAYVQAKCRLHILVTEVGFYVFGTCAGVDE